MPRVERPTLGDLGDRSPLRGMSTNTTSRIHPFSATLVGFIAGLKKHYAGQTVMLDGKSYTADALELLFQSCVDAETGAVQATVAKTTAVKQARDSAAQVRPVASAFKKAVLAAYGADPTTLADFDLEPPKQAVKTPAVKQAAAEKAKATREALGTKGPKQKEKAKKQIAASAAQAPQSPATTPAPTAAPATVTPSTVTPTPAKS
ncbi:MAG TPA: hypothetical protein VMI75_01915 [Polyangiaceae bacterium]|nr:hypothetical protein [Polyangiaceae bacterium]